MGWGSLPRLRISLMDLLLSEVIQTKNKYFVGYLPSVNITLKMLLIPSAQGPEWERNIENEGDRELCSAVLPLSLAEPEIHL